MKIGEIAKKTGLTTRAIRYYEELNIINPKYSKGGIRIFSELDFIKINLVNMLKKLDFPLCKIQSILSSEQNIDCIKNSIDLEINKLKNTISEIEKIKKENTLGQEIMSICKNCDKKPNYITCNNCPNIEESKRNNFILKSLN